MCLLEMEYIYSLERWQFLKDAEEKKKKRIKTTLRNCRIFHRVRDFSGAKF